ncbi:DUF2917 domain-containing protein [Piscinibacter koreensis]|uniref:DUF2917 domain-containing protein n=1 Tax=Piscinibacter koreensis TaxID=2742824 RepID=A0A7Y6TYP5_9BURK|nr:DUF2917 domain-containing protein [Schlegelella koreensis]NUZ08327.1 DUF2917 domain-containing protein [Schlegelella koreensis]
MDARTIDPTHERMVSLRNDELARMSGAARLCVTRGLLWLTLDRQPDDHMLRPGDRFTLPRGAHALLQGLAADTRVLVVEPAPSALQRAARTLQVAMLRVAGATP